MKKISFDVLSEQVCQHEGCNKRLKLRNALRGHKFCYSDWILLRLMRKRKRTHHAQRDAKWRKQA